MCVLWDSLRKLRIQVSFIQSAGVRERVTLIVELYYNNIEL